MNERLDVVTTALRRPDLLDLTYKSFFGRIQKLPRLRIIINIDPLGPGSVMSCVQVAKKYSSEVVWRSPDQPGFMSAIKWCYSQVESAVVLHLEDDWLLKREIDFKHWESELLDKNLAQTVLLMKKPRLDEDIRYSLRPNLCRSDLVVPALIQSKDSDLNPEKSLGEQTPFLASGDFITGGDRLILDMGRKWAKAQGLKKIVSDDGWFGRRHIGYLSRAEYRLCCYYWRAISSWVVSSSPVD